MSSTKDFFYLLNNDTTSDFFENTRKIMSVYSKKYEALVEERNFLWKMEYMSNKKKAIANQVPTTHATLVELWESLAPYLRENGAIVAGGFVSSYIKWDDKKIPGDMDVWFPKGSQPDIPPGWSYSRSYYTGPKMPINIKQIKEYVHPKYQIKLQLMIIKEQNPFNIVENFDFDVCKGVMSPGLDKDGKIIGIRATKPEVYRAIMSNTATFLERDWDIDAKGLPNLKCLNRFIKYGAKGYKMAVHKDSNFTIDLINEMVLKLKETGKQTDESSYNALSEKYVDNSDNYSTFLNKIFRSHMNFNCDVSDGTNTHCVFLSEQNDRFLTELDKYTPTQDADVYYLTLIMTLYHQRAVKAGITDEKYMSYQQKEDKRNADLDKARHDRINAYINQIYMFDKVVKIDAGRSTLQSSRPTSPVAARGAAAARPTSPVTARATSPASRSTSPVVARGAPAARARPTSPVGARTHTTSKAKNAQKVKHVNVETWKEVDM